MNGTDLIGYTMEGDVYCVECTIRLFPKSTKCKCRKDENDLCEENCSGNGPNPIFVVDDVAIDKCSECGQELMNS